MAQNRRFRFENFVPGRDRWATYEARLTHALEQQGFGEPAAQKQAFLSILNNEMHEALESMLYPVEIGNGASTFARIMAVLRRRYSTADLSPAAAEQEFLNRAQKPGESVADWVADLQRLAAICRFGQNGLNGRLKAQLIRGAADMDAKRKLLRKSADYGDLLTLDRTLDILRSYEAVNAELNQNTGTTAGQAWAAVHSAASR